MIVTVITARDEAATIGELVRALRDGIARAVIVVDAGSTDDTVARAAEAGAITLRGPGGIGPNLTHGWREALAMGATRILQIDAGGSHDPLDARGLLAVEADLVIGSRFRPGGAYRGRLWRAALSRGAALALNLAQAGAHHTDWTSGYRVLSARAARYLAGVSYACTMHGWQIEVLARAGEAGLRIAEAPIRYTAGASAFGWPIAAEALRAYLEVSHHIGWVGSRLREEGLS